MTQHLPLQKFLDLLPKLFLLKVMMMQSASQMTQNSVFQQQL